MAVDWSAQVAADVSLLTEIRTAMDSGLSAGQTITIRGRTVTRFELGQWYREVANRLEINDRLASRQESGGMFRVGALRRAVS